MTDLTFDRRWLNPDFTPPDLTTGVFLEEPVTPFAQSVLELELAGKAPTYQGTLNEFAADLVDVLRSLIALLPQNCHCLLSGGYDSRILAFLLEDMGKNALYIHDGAEPNVYSVHDHLDIPANRIYCHDMTQNDPYGLERAVCDGFAPLWSQIQFFPEINLTKSATLITGLGGGEWFAYPAHGWHRGKPPRSVPFSRLAERTVIELWADCWPQYTLIHEAWGRNYKSAVHPYTTTVYAALAGRVNREWLTMTPYPALDRVRHAMLCALDPNLIALGYSPHYYDWNLNADSRSAIDVRYCESKLAKRHHRPEWGWPSEMERSTHANTLAGFATWCDALEEAGAVIRY